MKKKNLYLLSEITNREFESKVLLSITAASFNIRTFILDRTFFFENIKKFHPGIVMYKSIVEVDEKYIDIIKNHGHKFLCLDEEGILTQKQTYDLKFRHGQNCLKKLDHMFFLNKYWLGLLKKNFKVENKKFSVTGFPRMQFMKYLSRYNDNISSDIKKKYGKFIFVPTSFPSNNIAGKNGFFESISLNFNNGMNLKQKKYMSLHLDFYLHYQHLYKKMLTKLISDNKNINFVIRPHPGEDNKFWEKNIINLKNVFFDKNYATSYWVKSSVCTLQFFSTISIESFNMHKPIIEYMPKMPKKFQKKILMDYHRSFILRFSTYEKLNLLIKKIVKGKKVNLDMISRNKYNKNFLSAQILEPATEILKIIDTFDAIKTEKNLKIYSIFSKTNVYRFIFWLIAHLGILTLLPQKILKGKFLVLKKENIPFHKYHYKYKKKKYEVVTDERLKSVIEICKKGLKLNKKKIEYKRIKGNNFVFLD